jgi:hypothetical protein
MGKRVADVLVETLQAGVKTRYGIVGDSDVASCYRGLNLASQFRAAPIQVGVTAPPQRPLCIAAVTISRRSEVEA